MDNLGNNGEHPQASASPQLTKSTSRLGQAGMRMLTNEMEYMEPIAYELSNRDQIAKLAGQTSNGGNSSSQTNL